VWQPTRTAGVDVWEVQPGSAPLPGYQAIPLDYQHIRKLISFCILPGLSDTEAERLQVTPGYMSFTPVQCVSGAASSR